MLFMMKLQSSPVCWQHEGIHGIAQFTLMKLCWVVQDGVAVKQYGCNRLHQWPPRGPALMSTSLGRSATCAQTLALKLVPA